MKTTIKDVSSYLEMLAPLAYAEDFDNVGLLVGNAATEVTGVLVTLDTLEGVVDEAIDKKCNLIVSFHPIIFKGLKRLNGDNYVERTVIKALQHGIAIYAMHTALDNVREGVSGRMAQKLGLQDVRILMPKQGWIHKLSVYVPEEHADRVRQALFAAGAGTIGKYSDCSFNVKGLGTFKGNEASNPVKGKPGKFTQAIEVLINVVYEKQQEAAILKSLREAHPYEEIAYQIVATTNSHQDLGMGVIGDLEEALTEQDFLNRLKHKFKLSSIRHSALRGEPVKKVAMLGGSGSFGISSAKRMNADVYISADFKYHDFFQAENKIVLCDIGHYESEQFTKNLLVDYLTKKFRNFAVVLSETNTNPINYI